MLKEESDKSLKQDDNKSSSNWISPFLDNQIGLKEILVTAILTSIVTTLSSCSLIQKTKRYGIYSRDKSKSVVSDEFGWSCISRFMGKNNRFICKFNGFGETWF